MQLNFSALLLNDLEDTVFISNLLVAPRMLIAQNWKSNKVSAMESKKVLFMRNKLIMICEIRSGVQYRPWILSKELGLNL